jgi:hypothetical protein
MNIRTEWMTDAEYFGEDYNNNVLLNDGIARFNLQQESLEGRDALVDTVAERIVVQNHTNPINQAKYDKKVSFPIESNVHRGSLLEFDDKKWLVTSKVFDKYAYLVGSVLMCDGVLSLYKNNLLYEVPYVIESQARLHQMQEEGTRVIKNPDTTIVMRVQDNDINRMITRNDIFKLKSQNFRVLDFNNVIEDGIIVLKLDHELQEQDVPTYTIEITNGSAINIQESTQLQLNVKVYADGVLMDVQPTVAFNSSNKSICTVSSLGLVTVKDIVGTSTITASYGEASTFIDVSVVANVQDNFTVSIYGESTLYNGYTDGYFAIFKNNGAAISDVSMFYIRANDGVSLSGIAEIISQNAIENTCVIKAHAIGTFKLFVKNGLETIISEPLTINIVNLF